MRKPLITVIMLIFIFLFTSAGAQAQSIFQFGGALALGFPQGEFKENVDNGGIGGNLHFNYRFPQSPLSIGASITFLIYGSERREEPFSTTIPDVWVDVTTTNNLVMAHLLFRLQPRRGAVLPYLDGLFGLNYLWTETRIEDQDDFEDVAIFIDAGVRYLKGGKAEYLKKGSIRRENGSVLYDVNESTTDILTFRIGAVVNF